MTLKLKSRELYRMMIRLYKDRNAEIVNPYDLKGFHIEAHGFDSDSELAELNVGLKEFSTRESSDHSWVSVAALKDWHGLKSDETFQDCIIKLIGIAKKYGWYNQGNDTIRAHIEFEAKA